MHHTHSLQVQRGLSYYGSAHRLRRVMHQLMMQPSKQLSLGVVGGSVSWGHGASRKGETDWFALVTKWMVRANTQHVDV